MSSRDAELLDLSAHVQTPFLVLDEAAIVRNITRMADLVEGTGVRLRPHFKAHKCPELMRLQLAAPNTVGATCQTVREAAVLVEAGCTDVLLTNQLADVRAVRLFAQLGDRAKLSILVDRPEHVDMLAASVPATQSLTVFVELDVGLGRGGFAANDPALVPTVEAIEDHPNLVLGGVQAYEGHAVLEPDPVRRRQLVSEAHARGDELRNYLADLVGRTLVLTGGGTGTAEVIAEDQVLDELQCGSYVLMDVAYDRLNLEFEAAMFCATTAVAAHPDGRVILDGGMKVVSGDGLPAARRPGLKVLGLSDEHTRARQPAQAQVVATGERVLLQPWHVDPTLNLHREVLVVGGGQAPRVWQVGGHHELTVLPAG